MGGMKSPRGGGGMSDGARRAVSIAALAAFVLFSALVMWRIGLPLVRYLSKPERFRSWVDEHGLAGRAAFLGMMILQVVIALIPGEVMEIGAGYAFGAVEGTLLCVAGTIIGSAMVFALVRRFGVRMVQAFFPVEKIHSLKLLKNPKRLNTVVFIVFVIPGTPKDLLAYAVGLTPMRPGTWLLITATARLPSVITSTVGGDALGSGQYGFAIAVFAVTMALSAAGLIVYNRFFSSRGEKPEQRGSKGNRGEP